MLSNENSADNNICALIMKRINECDFRIAQTERNMKTKQDLEKSIAMYTPVLKYIKYAIADMKSIIDDTQSYLAERRREATQSINNALYTASNVVSDGVQGVKIKTDGEQVWLTTEEGRLLSDSEGGGYRSTIGVLMNLALLKSNPDHLQFLMLDEALAKLSPENSAIISSYLPIIAEDCQIISIEQKDEIFADAAFTSYEFFLDEQGTHVQRRR